MKIKDIQDICLKIEQIESEEELMQFCKRIHTAINIQRSYLEYGEKCKKNFMKNKIIQWMFDNHNYHSENCECKDKDLAYVSTDRLVEFLNNFNFTPTK